MDFRQKESYKIVIRWYLGWCKSQGCYATVESVRRFAEEKRAELSARR
ncbi:MAG: hypothetical protein LR015_13970 [Verrucomicrobia bacterium]|nr:hypothetical protein [Verrucomicrobiota bacterium]